MHAKGYALAADIARAVGVHKSSAIRWADRGKVKEIAYLRGRYLEVNSVVKHLGLDADAALRLRKAVLTGAPPAVPAEELASRAKGSTDATAE